MREVRTEGTAREWLLHVLLRRAAPELADRVDLIRILEKGRCAHTSAMTPPVVLCPTGVEARLHDLGTAWVLPGLGPADDTRLLSRNVARGSRIFEAGC